MAKHHDDIIEGSLTKSERLTTLIGELEDFIKENGIRVLDVDTGDLQFKYEQLKTYKPNTDEDM